MTSLAHAKLSPARWAKEDNNAPTLIRFSLAFATKGLPAQHKRMQVYRLGRSSHREQKLTAVPQGGRRPNRAKHARRLHLNKLCTQTLSSTITCVSWRAVLASKQNACTWLNQRCLETLPSNSNQLHPEAARY